LQQQNCNIFAVGVEEEKPPSHRLVYNQVLIFLSVASISTGTLQTVLLTYEIAMLLLSRPTLPIACLIGLCCILFPSWTQGQLLNTEFGQNRIQYEKKDWYRYESEHFDIYYAKEDEVLARFLLPVLELDYVELSRLFEHQLKKKVQVVVHSDYSDYMQSNIGIPEHRVNEGGQTNIVTPKMQLYFTGDHNELRQQMREGLAQVLLGKVLTGTSLQEMVQNSVLMNLPSWFLQGAVAYAAEGWNTEMDDRLRDILLSGKYENFVELAKKEPLLAGQSLFHFISQEHSPSTISNLLYLTRINRSVENGFLYVFGKTYYQVVGSDWFNYYKNRYNSDNNKRRIPVKGELELHLNKKSVIKQLALSPNSKYVAYVEHNRGVRKVILQEVATNERKVLYRTGERDLTGDYERHYPLLAWNTTSDRVIIVHEKGDKIYQRRQSIKGDKSKDEMIFGLERVLDIAVWNNSTLMATAIKDGHTDLYQIKGGSLKALSNDFWDEKEVAVATLQGQKGLIFSSNRGDAPLKTSLFSQELPSTNFDLFFYNPSRPEQPLLRLTRTPIANERAPITMGKGDHFTYLSDENGFYNRYVAILDSVLLREDFVVVLQDSSEFLGNPDSSYTYLPVDTQYFRPVYVLSGLSEANTDYSRNILLHDGNASKVADLIYNQGQYHIFVRDARPDREMEAVKKTTYRLILEKQRGLLRRPKSTAAIVSPIEMVPTPNTPINTDRERPLRLELEEPSQDSVPPVDTGAIDIDNYQFQSEFKDIEDPEEAVEVRPLVLVEDGKEIRAIERPQNQSPTRNTLSESKTKLFAWDSDDVSPYKSLFKINQLTFQMDNTPLFNGMNMYLGGYYEYQPLSFAFKTSFVDVFEHFDLEVGLRLPLDFNGMEYYVTLENKKGRVDQKFSFYRRGRINNYTLVDTVSNETVEASGRAVKHWVEAEFSYPLTKFQSIRARVGAQLDKVAILADDVSTLAVPVYHENRLNLRFEYVFDNAISIYTNAWKGTKFKAYLDFYKPFTVQNADRDFNVGLEGGLTTAIGFDLRRYWSFDNKTVFAVRAAAASSFGQQKILYSLGGVENWMFPTANTTITLPDAQNYGLQTLAANLRGFNNNARNGSSYALINAEMRIPIVDYLTRNSPRNTVLRNLQLIAFLDVGTAWQGLSPFSPDNPLNTTFIDNGVSPVRLVVNYYRRPILMGYGFGIRTVLLDHYFRMDYAWGVETGQVQEPVVYFSVGTDF
jgi:hypothetical protein